MLVSGRGDLNDHKTVTVTLEENFFIYFFICFVVMEYNIDTQFSSKAFLRQIITFIFNIYYLYPLQV